MRLGKAQAAGYVADTDSQRPEEIEIDQPERTGLTPDPEPALPVG